MMASRAMDETMYTALTNGQADSTNGSAVVNRGSDGVLDAIRMDTQDDGLDFDNAEHPPELLVAMGTLRRQSQFCDAVLRVDEREVGDDNSDDNDEFELMLYQFHLHYHLNVIMIDTDFLIMIHQQS